MATTDDRIAALEAVVAELRAQLERPPLRDSMSHTRTCPSCGGGSLIGVRRIDEHKDGGGLVPLAIGNTSGFWSSKAGAPLQAYICRNCRLVEWHVASLDALAPDGHNIIELERPVDSVASDAPYR